ncbi:MAG: type II secretion system protein [Candidatus Omnitrophota bacterium]
MRKGFTLIEAVIVIFILGIVVAGLIPILFKGIEISTSGMSSQEDLAKARIALERMVSEIRDSECICSCLCSGGSCNSSLMYIPTSKDKRIYFATPSADPKNKILRNVYTITSPDPTTCVTLCNSSWNSTATSSQALIDSLASMSPGNTCISCRAFNENGVEQTSYLGVINNSRLLKIKFILHKKSGGELPFETQVVLRKRVP